MMHARQIHYTHASWLPHQRALAVLTNATGSMNQLAIYDLLQKQLRIVTHGEESIHSIHPSPKGDTIVYTASQGGHEKMQMYLYMMQTQEHRALTFNPLAVHRSVAWSPDGRFVVYAANSTHEEEFHIFELNVLTHEITPVVADEGCFDSLGYSPSGRYIVIRKRKSFHDHELYVWDRNTRTLHLIMQDTSDIMEVQSPFWSPDESVLFVISNWNADRMRVLAIHLSSGHIQPIYESTVDIDVWAMSADTQRAVLCENVNGRHRMQLIERVQGQWTKTVEREIHGYARKVQWSSDDQLLSIEYQSPFHFAHLLIVNSALELVARIPQQEEKVHEPEAPHPKEFECTTADGVRIQGWYFVPKEVKAPLPVVVHLHGGPEDQFRYQYNQWIHRLVDAGYAVVAPNVRGSLGYGKRFLSSDNKEKRFDAIAELKDIHAWIAEQPFFDAKKVALSGGSYGAYLTLAGLVWHPDLWQVGICRIGMYNLYTFLNRTAPWRKYLRAFEYGDPDTEKELLISLSPLSYIDRITSPVLFIHGQNDVRVPVSEVEQTVEALKSRGMPVEKLIFENEGHGIEQEEHVRAAQQKSLLFLEQYLLQKKV